MVKANVVKSSLFHFSCKYVRNIVEEAALIVVKHLSRLTEFVDVYVVYTTRDVPDYVCSSLQLPKRVDINSLIFKDESVKKMQFRKVSIYYFVNLPPLL